MNYVNKMLFDGHGLGFKGRLAISKIRLRKPNNEDDLKFLLSGLLEDFNSSKTFRLKKKLNRFMIRLHNLQIRC